MSVLYFKVLSEYYHHIISDLDVEKRDFLEKLYNFILANDEYGYPPDLSGDISRIVYLLKQISIGAAGMSIDEYLIIKSWYSEDGWAAGEIDEYFLYHKKEKEIKIICDFHSLNSEKKDFLKNLDIFLQNKGKTLKGFNPHNGKYQKISEILD